MPIEDCDISSNHEQAFEIRDYGDATQSSAK